MNGAGGEKINFNVLKLYCKNKWERIYSNTLTVVL